MTTDLQSKVTALIREGRASRAKRLCERRMAGEPEQAERRRKVAEVAEVAERALGQDTEKKVR